MEEKMDYIMETMGLRKSYRGNVVVDNVNIHIPRGAVYGFVGPNGAGKSTVMKMVLNLIQPDAGEVHLFGEKVTDHSYEVFKRVGSIIENPYFYEKMTARQNLELHCEYMGFPNRERIDEVLQMGKLFQRLNRENGTTVFISSHILSEVDLLADTIGILRHGKLLAELPVEEIHKRQTEYVSLQVDDVPRAASLLEKKGITNFTAEDQEFIRVYDSDLSGKTLSKYLVENGVGLESLGRRQDTLEDYFFQLTEEGD